MLDRFEMRLVEDDVVHGLVSKLKPSNVLDVATQLYPEYSFSHPFGVWTGNIPLHAVLPFYRKIIVHLDSYRDRRTFRGTYSVSPEEMAELHRRGRIILLLRSSYEQYPGFYDVLLEDHLPQNNRLERVYLFTQGQDIQQYHELLERRFFAEINSLPPALERSYTRKARPDQAKELVVRVMAQRIVKLSMIGMGDQALEIVASKPLEEAHSDLHAYNRALAVPLVDAMGGWDNLDAKHITLLKRTPLKEDIKRVVLPRDMLYWLNQQLGYRYPTEVSSGLSYLDSIEQVDEAAENHKILEEMQRAFLESDFGTCQRVIERSAELLSAWEKHLLHVENSKQSFRRWVSRPVRYACFLASPFAFALMEQSLASGRIPEALGYGVLGAGTALLIDRIKELERLVLTLRHGSNLVPTILWSQLSRRR